MNTPKTLQITLTNATLSQLTNLTTPRKIRSKDGKESDRYFLNLTLDPTKDSNHRDVLTQINSFVNEATGGTGQGLEYIVSKRKAYKRDDNGKKITNIQGEAELVDHPSEVSVAMKNFSPPRMSGLEEGSDVENVILPSHSIVNVKATLTCKTVGDRTFVNLYMNEVDLVKRGESQVKGSFRREMVK